jgi:hypothetical protein
VCHTPFDARIHSTPPAGSAPSRPVVSANWMPPSSITVTVAMPECGCHPNAIGLGA